MEVAIIKYNAGNIYSVQNALQKLGVNSFVTDDKEKILTADKVIFPGVGEASTAMNYLENNNLDIIIKNLKQPFLGICLGLQLMCNHSEEGNTKCLGIFNTRVRKFPDKDIVPHMGWNNLTIQKSKLLQNLSNNDDFYFVHSYFAEIGENTVAQCDYINPFSAVLQKNNFYAVQFHPEKSAKAGSILLQNFLNL